LLMSVRRMAEELFSGEGARLLLAGNALHADFSPEGAGSGVFGVIMAMLGQTVGFPVPEGGAGALTQSLARRLESRGGQVQTSADVSEVLVRSGRAVGVRLVDGTEIAASRAVVASVTAPALYGRLVAPEHLPARVRRGIRPRSRSTGHCRHQSRGGTVRARRRARSMWPPRSTSSRHTPHRSAVTPSRRTRSSSSAR